ncbi:Rieske (2Fe-2S) protein [Streptomyces sp. NPDC006193]|uniref:Rieske (2Fe-2S) protein n=1 Tax=Streptomyces sp. NPDC006193 TaxID=3155717 RepID=UPI0033B625DA
MSQPTTRRTVLATGAGALALGCAGCGGDGGSAAPSSPASSPSASASSSPAVSRPSSPATASAPPAGEELARTADIPEGGGRVIADRKVVVTQPSKGEFKAFSAVCTHQGCTVSRVADGTIDCPCHGSAFRIADGSVARGPATRPLAEKPVMVHGNSVHLA